MTDHASLTRLLSTEQDTAERALAARYAPIIRFDTHEPFLPDAVGYTIFRVDGPSPSFPRSINLSPDGQPAAALAIEYAIWWDWDIQHLYELEHAWIYVDEAGRVIRAEASWHGGYHDMAVDGRLELEGDRLVLYSEPGKHAFAPAQAWLDQRGPKTIDSCGGRAGRGGVWITPLFAGIIDCKSPLADRLVHTYLERHAFQPGYDFSRRHPLPAEHLVPWPALQHWIPGRVAWWIAELERQIPPHERRFLRIAHRGASAYAPENTLAAIRKAAELGADMVELDVQLSADGVAVIIHDLELSRLSGGTGLVESKTLSELQALDVGEGERIPTLAEAVDCCQQHKLGLYLEIKSGRAVPAVAEIVQAQDLYGQVLVTSFRPDWLADLKALDPAITTSVLFGAVELDPVALAQSVGASYVHPAWERRAPEPHKLLTDEWIARVRAAGLGIICWHEERPSEIAGLRRLGVDGICSDTPDRLMAAS